MDNPLDFSTVTSSIDDMITKLKTEEQNDANEKEMCERERATGNKKVPGRHLPSTRVNSHILQIMLAMNLPSKLSFSFFLNIVNTFCFVWRKNKTSKNLSPENLESKTA